MAQEAGEVTIEDPDFNRHYASVLFEVQVEATFLAVLNPEFEDIADFALDGITALYSSPR